MGSGDAAAETVPSITTASEAVSVPSAPTGLMGHINRWREYGTAVFKERKPWGEFLDRNSFGKPANVSEAVARLQKNWAYFKTNYFIIVFASTCICMLLNPGSLLVLGLLLSVWLYLFVLRTSPLVINGRTIGDREKLLGMTVVTLVMVFFLSSVGTTLLYALSVGMGVAVLHGSFRVPDDLFLDDGGQSSQGLLSLFNLPPQPAVIATNV